ncbi:hypothetical protein THIOM_003187 [Candidatus Thiomargarita nelsonii]|uniref:Uncharacterized protein n=1 Tax=Candidatus Thiomargarita nelsonii TaxID=1003181 RepID=A0A176RZ41_9GAMM|nr:hypothetical protein THIOM_003187 [Candidatus Thiomargarita nelsonii]
MSFMFLISYQLSVIRKQLLVPTLCVGTHSRTLRVLLWLPIAICNDGIMMSLVIEINQSLDSLTIIKNDGR